MMDMFAGPDRNKNIMLAVAMVAVAVFAIFLQPVGCEEKSRGARGRLSWRPRHLVISSRSSPCLSL